MAPTKPAADFNAMLNAQRERKRNEAVAQRMLGKDRRSSAPGVGVGSRKGGSLASRVGPAGVTKHTASIKPGRGVVKPTPGNVDSEWTHDLHSLNNPATTSRQPPRGPKTFGNRDGDRLVRVLNGSVSSPALNSQFNVVRSAKPISIRGAAGPYTVVVKNLALGTTAADAESAMLSIGGPILSCRLVANNPTVIAEVVFENKEGADNVVDTLNNQNADGNILHVYHKLIPSAAVNPLVEKPATRAVTPLGPRAAAGGDRVRDTRSAYTATDRYPRERSRDRRRDYDRENVQDGSYGFDDRMDTDERDDSGRGLYSDSMVNSGRGAAGGGRRQVGGWDRGRGARGRGYNR